MKTTFSVVRVLCVAILLMGCVSIPPEAPELSTELGERISAIEQAHMTLLYRFFDQKRADIDRFIQNEWVPIFAEEFFGDRRIAAAWEIIVREDDDQQRLRFLTEFGPRLQAKINEKRVEFISPIDDLERRLEQRIRGEYEQAKSINNTLTSLLLSASEVAENRNRYLEMLGITDDQIGKIIDDTDGIVSDLLDKSKDAESAVNAAEEYLGKLQELISNL